jgi:hypothetical protein
MSTAAMSWSKPTSNVQTMVAMPLLVLSEVK